MAYFTATTLLVLATAGLDQAATAFVLPSSSSSTASSRGNHQESSTSSTRIASTFAREPQTFATTNFGFASPQSQYGVSSLSRRQNARDRTMTGSIPLESFPNDGAVTVHGGVLRTWSFDYATAAEMAEVHIRSEGAPVTSSVELWEGPNYAPVYVRTYSQDGNQYPLSVKLMLDRSRSSSLAVRNTGPNTFPFEAAVTTSNVDVNFQNMLDQLGNEYEENLQGGGSLSYPIDSSVDRTQLMLRTGGRPLNVRVELMQGPSNNKLVAEVQSMDGVPMMLSFETPGYSNVLRIINLSPLEFPIISFVDPSHLDNRGMEDRRHMYLGGSSSFSQWGNGRGDRSMRGGERRAGYGGSSNNGMFRNNRDLGFKSNSMSRSADTSRRTLYNDVNRDVSRNYAAPVLQEPYTSKNNLNGVEIAKASTNKAETAIKSNNPAESTTTINCNNYNNKITNPMMSKNDNNRQLYTAKPIEDKSRNVVTNNRQLYTVTGNNIDLSRSRQVSKSSSNNSPMGGTWWS